MLCSKILVAYDGSDQAEKALLKAVELAKLNEQIEILVLHVVSPSAPYTGYEYIPSPDIIELVMKQGSKTLQQAEKVLAGIPNKWNKALHKGYPAETILDYAKTSGCDLIVIGSRGLSGLKELFLGSVSHNVVQHSPVPVLVVK
ncbi:MULTISPECIES: universal stress protein [Paenibacillus]|uniref:Universal stress protein family protein n=1 Tax=Paenibacillus naphthalenovorans TaxID=162209 RepID=A0A0U2UFA5_9BACL|nr:MULTISPECIES: universal stress protein [Paenibacillus]ALS20593.1 universal stress protein family protein [Paenibacillus naphthalenovorans]NTZ18000.1 universal stress protein [Paenibacillus sp. JMULE4]GCL73149.1 universal stress protein [Paenibacillus naphthalenovorans]SDJ88946.1 Nucleotide-binding universal stress protein, UspA family [Paenibacillus naphthalenovorans]